MNLKALTNAVRPAARVIATQLQPEAFAVPEVIGQRSLTLGHDRRLQEMERSSAFWPRQAYLCRRLLGVRPGVAAAIDCQKGKRLRS